MYVYYYLQIDKMEAKVVKPLMEYEGVCKKAKVYIDHYTSTCLLSYSIEYLIIIPLWISTCICHLHVNV